MHQPIVSVVMPVHNGAAHLDEALRSVERQTFTDFELVAVDDGSTDASWTILEAHAERDPRIRPVRNERNLGHQATSNRAIAEARGRYVARLDQDDVAFPTRLDRTVEAFHRAPDIGVVYGDYARWFPDGSVARRSPPPTHAAIRVAQLFGNWICHSTLAVRADLLASLDACYRDVPGPQDYDLLSRLLPHAASACVTTPLAAYRQSEMAMTAKYADRMAAAVDEISSRQLADLVGRDDIASTRAVFNLDAGVEDVRGIAAVHHIFEQVPEIDVHALRADARAWQARWTGQALRAAVAPGGRLPRAPRFVGELVRHDPAGARAWAAGEVAKARRRVAVPSG